MAREFVMGVKLTLNDAFSGPIKAAARATGAFREGMATATSQTNSFRKGMEDATRQSKSFREGLAGVAHSADSVGMGLKGAVAAIGGITAAVGLFKKSVGGAMQMEQTQMQISALVGDAEKGAKLFNMLNDMGLKSVFSESDFLNAGKAFLPITKDLGQLNKMLGITERLAASNPLEGMEGAAFAMRELASGDITSVAERFNIGKSDLRNAGFDSAGSAMSNIMALDKVLNDYGFTSKYIEKVNQSGAAQWDMLQSNMATAIKKSGMAALDMLKGPLKDLNDWMGGGGLKVFTDTLSKTLAGTVKVAISVGKAFVKYSEPIKNVATAAGQAFKMAYNIVAGALQGIWNVSRPIIAGIKKNWSTWGPIFQTTSYALAAFAVGLGAVKTALTTSSVAMRLLNAAMLTNPIGWIILGIGLLIGAFIKLNGGIEGTKKVLAGWFSQAKTFWQSDQVQGWVSKAVTAFNWLVQKAGEVIAWIRTNRPKIQIAITGVFMKTWAIIGPVVTQIVTNIVSAFSAVSNWFMQYWPGIQRFFTLFWAWVGPYVMAALKILWSVISNGFKLIWNTVQNVWNMITGVIQVAWGIISGILGVGLALLVGNWGGAWDAMLGMLRNVWDGLGKFFSGLGGLFYDSGKAIIKTLVDGIKAMAEAPVNAVKNVFDKVREFLPFSDAKRGPLAELTYSGGAIMTTLGEGVWKKASSLSKSISGAFSESGINIAPERVTATAPAAPAAATAAPTLQFGDVHIQTSEGTDTVALAREVIDQLYSQANAAARTLSSGNKAALLG
ncbi:phage tail protein [Paenibacillus naphthalenovorans]|uniref:phage tail protein n=1 Tax=Paenibacillus naphthalenovorans TaxID=162209 RepID=UPI003D26DFA7